MPLQDLLGRIGPEIEDPEEETFLLFSQDIPSQNLGFVDSRAATLSLAVAVVWKITPLVAEFLASPANVLRSSGVLTSSSSVLELGCGISGLVGLAVVPTVQRYVLTDQQYVARFIERNISENIDQVNLKPSGTTSQKRKGKPPAGRSQASLRFTPLDWEQDEVTTSLTGDDSVRSFDVVLACDCIYNEALIQPLVQTCVDVCRLRTLDTDTDNGNPTICVVAQQLRDPDILEGWMKEFYKYFRTWRFPEEALSEALRSNPGFVIHIGVLRDTI
ncbi:Ribosomal protein lysine methyltransferase [Diatrype stigma]|uniref:Ribosomal protein lysine methyltransferase n=1 Tax=Diatrype stigma TaxID=117547 RepID=A0AAN9UL65_9PEZI